MKKLFIFLLSLSLFFGSAKASFAQSPSPQAETETVQQEFAAKPSEFYLAKVKEIVEESEKDLGAGIAQPIQKIKLSLLNGSEKGKEIEVEHGSLFAITEEQKVKKGELVVITKAYQPEGEIYYVADRFRIATIAAVFGLILLVWAVLGRGRNMGMLISLIGGLVVTHKYLVPKLIISPNPYPVILISVILILALIIFIGFGISRKSTIIFIAAFLVSLLGLGLTYLLVKYTGLSGAGGEEAIFLQTGAVDATGLKSLLIAGITVGVLGAISFVVKRQVELVESIKMENKKLMGRELLSKILINPDNNISAYVLIVFMLLLGTTLPLIMLFGINQAVPFWVTFNSEFMMGEIIRIVATIASIVLAVPVTTLVAVNLLPSSEKK